jgi:hypothetical protein
MHWEIRMEMISDENCIELLKEKFPKFVPYWESYKDFAWDLGLTIRLIPFGDYVIDVIKSDNQEEIKRIFDFVEFLLINGDESVQTCITTGFLEHLLSEDPEQIQFKTFAKFLGPNSISYCKAWDEFCGMRTEGLWD